MGLKHGNELLQQVAAGASKLAGTQVGNIKVALITDETRYEFGFAEALDVIANGLYWDERGNWADARRAEVETF